MRPFEQDLCDWIDGVIWSPDGKYFMASTKASLASNRGISIWDVESGRHRAELNGCVSNSTIPPFTMLKDKVIEGCGDSVIRVWYLADAFSRINTFDKQIGVR